MAKHTLLSTLFSPAYRYFLPAMLVSTIFTVMPVPEMARIGLFLWALPLFSAGAAHALHEGQDSLWQLIHRRCPMQGIVILLYALAGFMAFFILLFSDFYFLPVLYLRYGSALGCRRGQ